MSGSGIIIMSSPHKGINHESGADMPVKYTTQAKYKIQLNTGSQHHVLGNQQVR